MIKKTIIQFLYFILINGNLVIAQQVNNMDIHGNSLDINKTRKSNFVKGEIIIKFKEGTISNDFLESNDEYRKCGNVKKSKEGIIDKKNSALSVYADKQLRKVVRKYKPSHGQSISRFGKNVNTFDFHNLMILEVDQEDDIVSLCETLSNYEDVEYAEPNYLINLDDTPPNDTQFSKQQSFEQWITGVVDFDIDANRAWDFTTGNYGVKVGIIDNGIDYHNIDLGGGVFGVDGAVVRGGWDYINNDSDPDYTENATYSHGTEVAGIIAGIRNNNVGIAGLAGGDGNAQSGSQLIALKVGPIECSDGTIACVRTSSTIEAIIEASMYTPDFGYGCHILNNSYGNYEYSESRREAVSIAAKNNVVFIASKGNKGIGDLHYPSDYDGNWVLSVGSSSIFDTKSYFSNTGNGIDVVAPGGGNTYTTTVVGSGDGNGDYRYFSGTSASAPHVAGLAALILAEAHEQGISLHHEDVEGIIEASADDINGGSEYDDEIGHGRINAGRALELMNDPWEIVHAYKTGGSIASSSGWYNTVLYNSGGGLASALYTVKRHEVKTIVNIPYAVTQAVWGRGSNESIGWSGASPNYQLGFCEVVSSNNNTATLRTYIYEVQSINGQSLGWYPATSGNVKFAYTFISSCKQVSLVNQTYNSDFELETCDLDMQNVTIQNNATVNINVNGELIINGTFDAKLGTTLKIE